jgi:uncharacterized integral membrane protein (TIGR00698 family)
MSRRISAAALAPGIALSAAVAVTALVAAPPAARILPLPAIVIALFIGLALNGLAARAVFRPGIVFCVKTVLQWAVALLGIRIGLAEIIALGPAIAGLVVVAMVVTIAAALAFARFNGQAAAYAALAGASTAICGASATLATATVVPNYPGKQADVAFVVVAANTLATVAMVAYPPLCVLLGFDAQTTGVMLGATIHDVAQVAGAGYAVSIAVGNTAVIVKMFRVFLLLPTVLGIGWYFRRAGTKQGQAHVAVPGFALAFLALCIVNSVAQFAPVVVPLYAPLQAILVEASNWGLLIAIGALGLSTSVSAIAALGWRHVTTVVGATLVILVVITGSLLVLRLA